MKEAFSYGVLQLLDLLCGSIFGLCAIGIFDCEPLIHWFWFVFMRESY